MSRRPTPEQAALLSEQAVADRLELDGWRILGVNVRTRFGELPIVARRGDMIVFVETTAPGQEVDARRRSRIRRMAIAWMAANPSLQAGVNRYRFDVVSVRDGLPVQHVTDAF